MRARDYYALLVSAALADGAIQSPERAHLESFARRLKLSPAEAREVEGDAAKVQLDVPSKTSDRDRMLRHLARIVAADGECSTGELRLLRSVGRRLGKSSEDIQAALEAAGLPAGGVPAAGVPARSGDGGAASAHAGVGMGVLMRQALFLGLAIPTIGYFTATPSVLGALGAMVVYGVVAGVIWRCPGCGARLSVRVLLPDRCRACEVPLVSRSTRERWTIPYNVLILVAVLAWGFGIRAYWSESEAVEEQAIESRLRAETEARIDVVMAALKAYQDKQQADPQSLSELIKPLLPHERERYKGPFLKDKSELEDAWGREFWFFKEGDWIEVRSDAGFKGGFAQPEKHIRRKIRSWMSLQLEAQEKTERGGR